jgi:hypothetical protein
MVRSTSIPYIRNTMSTVVIDIKDAVRGIRSQFAHLKSQSEVNSTIARAINHTAAKAKTAASRQIRDRYKIRAKDLKPAIKVHKANRTNLEAAVMAVGRPLPIYAFGARQTKRGVSVNVMGKRQVIRSAFVATMKSGHTGVFARGGYKGYQFDFRRQRVQRTGPDLSINEITTSSVPKMMANEIVISHLERIMSEQFPARLQHEVSRMLAAKGQS